MVHVPGLPSVEGGGAEEEEESMEGLDCNMESPAGIRVALGAFGKQMAPSTLVLEVLLELPQSCRLMAVMAVALRSTVEPSPSRPAVSISPVPFPQVSILECVAQPGT
ncbi:hypothetical protein P7K49_004032 [Saguinus oedipus]|uniref:Uncharacterized protein n=1 Tax=Saguinus oedipus TaxID=9490 RepID=A0ABQ9W688_SAGOE|nr:hypothetical protein P7K49_004032 [Saguinus oedipus]